MTLATVAIVFLGAVLGNPPWPLVPSPSESHSTAPTEFGPGTEESSSLECNDPKKHIKIPT
eukprot:4084452-Amphidinium_carterae.2